MKRIKLIILLAALTAGMVACTKEEAAAPDYDLYIPTAFTPDGDGVNDSFVVKGNTIAFHIDIYSPSNVLVYTRDDIMTGWDGRYKGDNMPPDYYLWVIDYTNIRNEKRKKSGYVELVR